MSSGILRKPRCTVNGLAVIECSVHQSSHRRADTFHAVLALDQPGAPDESYWADAAPIPIEVKATNDAAAGGWTTLFVGEADDVDVDFVQRVVNVSGRDKTAKLLETKTNEKWQNRTAPEIVRDIAGRVGLSADVVVSSPDKVGLIFKDDYNRISDQDVLYNVLARLAMREGCAMFVRKDRLIFKPEDQLGGGVFPLRYRRPTREDFAAGNFIRLKAHRNLAVAKNVTVNVKSWRQKQEQDVEAEYKSTGSGGDLTYTYRAPNLTKEQADKIAKGRHDEVVSRERSLDVEAPGDVSLDPEQTLLLTGTGTAFDQSYIISTVEHHFGSQGYRMTVSTRNKDKKRRGQKSK